MTVAQLLHGLRYSLQGNAKTKEGKNNIPIAMLHLRYIQRHGSWSRAEGWPVISVDTQKKEMVVKLP